MTFRPESRQQFVEEVFEQSKAQIRAVEGCRHMELLQHTTRPEILFTLSFWDDEVALEKYRQSELFQKTWARTKVLFAERAEAWSTFVLDAPPI